MLTESAVEPYPGAHLRQDPLTRDAMQGFRSRLSLSEKYRVVFVLSDAEGLPNEETAEILVRPKKVLLPPTLVKRGSA